MKSLCCSRILSAVSALCLGAFSQSLSAQGDVGGFLFQGCNPSALTGKAYFPIVSMDKKKITVDAGTKTRKVSIQAPCRVKARMSVTDRFVDVLAIDLGTTSMANLKRASDAIADAQFADAQAEAAISDVRTGATDSIGGGINSPMSVEQFEQDNEALQEETAINFDNDAYGHAGVADTVTIKGEMLPETDIKGAYCVLAVAYTVIDPNSGEAKGRTKVGRAKYLGDMSKDEIFKMRLRFSFNEFSLRDADFAFHLYDSNGQEIAMSTSKALKALSVDDFQKMDAALNKARKTG